jgi:hypothetical protein
VGKAVLLPPPSRPDPSGKIYFLLGVVVGLFPEGLTLIGITINVWLGGLILAVAFGLFVKAFWIWERTSRFHIILRIGTVALFALIYFGLIGRQMLAQYRKNHPQQPVVVLPIYPPPNGPGIRFEGTTPIPSSQMCGGLTDEQQIQCLCPRQLTYTLKALPAPQDNNYATEITITKPPEQFQRIRVFLRAMVSSASLVEIVPDDKTAKSITILETMDYDRFSFVISSTAPKSYYKVVVHSSEQMRLKCINQEN